MDGCRHCILEESVGQTKPQLRYLASKDAACWPVIVTVPVEAIESWLLTAKALIAPGSGNMRAEDLPAGKRLKEAFYDRPLVTTSDVESKAVGVITNPALNLDALAEHSQSFRLFFDSVRGANLS